MPGTIKVGWTSTAGLQPKQLRLLAGRLPEAEQDRARRLHLDAQRVRFVVGRALLRTLAASSAVAASEASATDMTIAIGSAGQLIGAGALDGRCMSLGHSGERVVAAVADRPVGVDVERLRAGDLHAGLAARVCSPAELGEIQALPEHERLGAFISVWTRKEAYGKALGVGLDFALRSVTAGPAAIGGVADTWQVCDLAVGEGYAAAVVAAGGDWHASLAQIDCRELY